MNFINQNTMMNVDAENGSPSSQQNGMQFSQMTNVNGGQNIPTGSMNGEREYAAAAPRSSERENVVRTVTFKKRDSNGTISAVGSSIVKTEHSQYRLPANYTAVTHGYSNQNQEENHCNWNRNDHGNLRRPFIEVDQISPSTIPSSSESEGEHYVQNNAPHLVGEIVHLPVVSPATVSGTTNEEWNYEIENALRDDDDVQESSTSDQRPFSRSVNFPTVDPSTISLFDDQVQPEQTYQQETMAQNIQETAAFLETLRIDGSPPQVPQHSQQPTIQEDGLNYHEFHQQLENLIGQRRIKQQEEKRQLLMQQEQHRQHQYQQHNQASRLRQHRTPQYRNHLPAQAPSPYPVGSTGPRKNRNGKVRVDGRKNKNDRNKTLFTFDQLITLCLLNKEDGCLTVAEMYPFIVRHFIFDERNVTWRNSLRHAVSEKPSVFKKIKGKTAGFSNACYYTFADEAAREIQVQTLFKTVTAHKDNLEIFRMNNPNNLNALLNGEVGFHNMPNTENRRHVRRNKHNVQQVSYSSSPSPPAYLQRNTHSPVPGPSRIVQQFEPSWRQLSPFQQAHGSPAPEMNGAMTPALNLLNSLIPTQAFLPGTYYQENRMPNTMNQPYNSLMDIRGQQVPPVPFPRRDSLMPGDSNMAHLMQPWWHQFSPEIYAAPIAHMSRVTPPISPGPSPMVYQMESWNVPSGSGSASYAASNHIMQTEPFRPPEENVFEQFVDYSETHQNEINGVLYSQPSSVTTPQNQEDLLGEFFMPNQNNAEVATENEQVDVAEEFLTAYPMELDEEMEAVINFEERVFPNYAAVNQHVEEAEGIIDSPMNQEYGMEAVSEFEQEGVADFEAEYYDHHDDLLNQ